MSKAMMVPPNWALPWNHENTSLILHGEVALQLVALGGDGLSQVLPSRVSRALVDNFTHALIAGLVWAIALAPVFR